MGLSGPKVDVNWVAEPDCRFHPCAMPQWWHYSQVTTTTMSGLTWSWQRIGNIQRLKDLYAMTIGEAEVAGTRWTVIVSLCLDASYEK